jgi:glutamate/tyrosine decarboxylase-like PLP-dependent enzyme
MNEADRSTSGLPLTGRDPNDVLRELRDIAKQEDARWETGQISGTYYHGGKQHYAFLNEVFGLFSHVNLLQRDLCASGTKFEGEIVRMTATMLNGASACGAVTSGGSESIMLPMLAYRDKARAERGVVAPEMVVPSTIHPAFSKGAHYFGIDLVRVPVGEDFRADVKAMRERITKNTIAIAGSAANYPHGLIDPLSELSDVALEHDIGMHVDACLGGFILPWIEKLGYDVPPFDFRLPGVTSMSCDTHKWGYGLKGASVVLYRSPALRKRQYFTMVDWAGGLYASPTMAGSRSGGISASTWAAMVTLGQAGYLDATRRIMTAADTIRAGVASIPELKVAGKPTFCIAVLSDVVDMYHVMDDLTAKGWRLNGLQGPPGFHICVTLPQGAPGVAPRFVEDLRAAVDYAKHPSQSIPMSGAIYGGGPAGLDSTMVDEMLHAYVDATYEVIPPQPPLF